MRRKPTQKDLREEFELTQDESRAIHRAMDDEPREAILEIARILGAPKTVVLHNPEAGFYEIDPHAPDIETIMYLEHEDVWAIISREDLVERLYPELDEEEALSYVIWPANYVAADPFSDWG